MRLRVRPQLLAGARDGGLHFLDVEIEALQIHEQRGRWRIQLRGARCHLVFGGEEYTRMIAATCEKVTPGRMRLFGIVVVGSRLRNTCDYREWALLYA